MTLAFPREIDPQETLEWFLGEIKKDIHTIVADSSEDGPPAFKRTKSTAVAHEESAFVTERLKALNKLDACKTAVWLPSQNSLRAVRVSDGERKTIRIIGLNKERKKWEGRGTQGLEDLYDQCVASAMEFLQGQPVPLLDNEPQRGGDEAIPLGDKGSGDGPRDDGDERLSEGSSLPREG